MATVPTSDTPETGFDDLATRLAEDAYRFVEAAGCRAQRLRQEAEAQLDRARDEARSILEAAKAEAERIVNAARSSAEAEVRAVREEFKSEVVAVRDALGLASSGLDRLANSFLSDGDLVTTTAGFSSADS